MTPMDVAWNVLKTMQQSKLYNWIEDYPGKKPVTAWRGAKSHSVAPRVGVKSNSNHHKKTDFDLEREGSWWVTGGPEPHATASGFGQMQSGNKAPVTIGVRGDLAEHGESVQHRSGEWNPINASYMNEAFLEHHQPLSFENLLFTPPSKTRVDSFTEEEEDEWDAKYRPEWEALRQARDETAVNE